MVSGATYWVLFALAAIPSIIFHEIAHGWVADVCGDHTARAAGRLSLNPLVHIDPFGTVLLPIILSVCGLPPVGYAKPVPVNINRLRKPRNQSVYVALAGPGTNIILSALAIVGTRLTAPKNAFQFVNGQTSYLFSFFVLLGIINLILAVFNLVPVPPLDGSVLIERLMPRKYLGAYFQFRAVALPFAMIIMVVALYLGVGASAEFQLQLWWLHLAGLGYLG